MARRSIVLLFGVACAAERAAWAPAFAHGSLAPPPPRSQSLLHGDRRQLREPAPAPKGRPAPKALARLRGGASPVEMAKRAYLGIPIVTRSWLSLILASAALSQVGVLPPELLALDAHAIARKLQLWRLVTSPSFFGGIGPQLLQKLYYLVQFGRGLEGTLGLGEYARALASCTAMLAIVFNVLGWQFLGDGLVMAVTVLACQQQPDAQMNMYGLNIPMAYMPFAQMCMSYLFSQQIPWNDIVGAIVGYIHYFVQDEVKPDSVIHAREAASSPKAKPRPGKGGTLGGGGGGARAKAKSNKGGKQPARL